MSGFLLDTNVVYMLAPLSAEAPAGFLDWLDRMDGDGRLFLSVVSVHEIEKGIALLDHKGATAKAASLKSWLSGLVSTYEDKIIGFDAEAAAIGGRLEAKALAAGHDPGMADAVIAGIAAVHELIIVTRNTKHFLPFGAAVLSPDEAAAEGNRT
ncbi:VapC toxin family PIN domain ribonuclease [Ectothiorhodospira shaposhnikovii]|uniref:type II toxin-antitoxin system VapC family toxin n=1 Tax=Ectothiorhodospira shaposhnikovii TaxID=1054 RepID=UPI0019053DB3|nr:type II toxin-antitoxin system VapC family toxin [Ectothiorhodospira shaposhnikovii]MBK1674172.1 VapC toxin family PIN domain ribonuclease [Ectothiorhodospira shaposhnikovii]